jgi:short-subunit dehydrogenase
MGAGGYIINVSSESVVVPFPYLLVYQSTKAGIERFSQGLEAELANRNIRVSVVRAGQMMDQDSTPVEASPEVLMRFAQSAAAVGINLRERPITQYASVTDVFSALVNSAPDLHIGLVTLTARKAAA